MQDALNNQALQLREMREAKMAQEEQVQEAQVPEHVPLDHLGVSISEGIPKWMVNNGKSH